MYSVHYALAAGEEDRFPLQLTAGNLLLIFLTLKQPGHKPPPGCSWMGRDSSVQVGDSSSTLERERALPLLWAAYSARYIQDLSFTHLPLQCLLWGRSQASLAASFTA